MNKDIILVGGFHEIIELCEDLKMNIVGIIDNILSTEYMGYPIIGNDKDAAMLYTKYKNIPLVITPDLPSVREKLVNHYSSFGYKFQTLMSKDSRISKSVVTGIGTIIQNGVNISSYSTIGNFVKINTNANIMHDSTIGDYTTIAPNVVVLGKVFISNMCYLGANSTILPNIYIEESTIVGAGAVVTKNTERTDIVVGVPAKKMIKKVIQIP